MIANNSSGVHALGYGSTIEFLDMVNVVYSDGSFGCVSNSMVPVLTMRKFQNYTDYYHLT